MGLGCGWPPYVCGGKSGDGGGPRRHPELNGVRRRGDHRASSHARHCLSCAQCRCCGVNGVVLVSKDKVVTATSLVGKRGSRTQHILLQNLSACGTFKTFLWSDGATAELSAKVC